ncbi:MAG: hypothetical protein AAFQ99_08040, partial [Pseudomonadota bacterium]
MSRGSAAQVGVVDVADINTEDGRILRAKRQWLMPAMQVDMLVWLDAVLILFWAVVVHQLSLFFVPSSSTSTLQVLQCALGVSFFVHVSMRHAGAYDFATMVRPENRLSAALGIGIRVISTASALALIGMSLQIPLDLPVLAVAAWFAAAGFSIAVHHAIVGPSILAAIPRGLKGQRIAIYGAGRLGERVRTGLLANDPSIRIVGMFDDRAEGDRRGAPANSVSSHTCAQVDRQASGFSVDGSFDELCAAVSRGEIDHIVLALPSDASTRIASFAARLRRLPVQVSLCTHLVDELAGVSGPFGQA